MTKAAAGVACGLIVDSREDSCDGFPRYQFLSDITVSYFSPVIVIFNYFCYNRA